MTEFEKSNWAKPGFSQGYRDNADIFIVNRKRMLAILQSFYVNFVKIGKQKTMLDLGCGDGIVTAAIADIDPSISATLVDGSSDMLKRAEEQLAELKNVRFVLASFEHLLREDSTGGLYDLIASSLAIHHLTFADKTTLIRYAYEHLKPGGYFVNIDVVLAPSDPLEQWYLILWREWIRERKRSLGLEEGRFEDVIEGYKDNKDNKPDTLSRQIDALRSAGFKDVDCYYKYGIFTIFGGKKQADAGVIR
jgi:tRNA (cmo5U34)-methyltransferase